jgi:hypothetical protein
MPAENRFSKVPGVLKHPRQLAGDLAEIIPVEPEQDNACAGKVASIFFLRVRIFQLFRQSAIHLKLEYEITMVFAQFLSIRSELLRPAHR